MGNNKIKITTGKIKNCAKGALEYGIASLIKQYEIKFNVKVNTVTLGEQGVKVDWQETASGIRTQEEIDALYKAQLEGMVASITKQIAGYEQ